MKRLLTASLFTLAFSVQSTLAADQTPSCKDWHSDQDWKLDQIDIAYVEPKDLAYSVIYENLKQHQILEELQEFLSPVRLPDKVLIQTEQCDGPESPYQPGGRVTICYEYIAKLAALATKIPDGGTTPRGVSRDDAMVGAFVQLVLNQMSHVIFDQQKIPIWGREEDAADKLAAFLMLQFPPETARKLVNGAAFFFEASDRTWTGSDFADAKSPEAQRFYNYLCIAYGSDPETFADFVAPSGQLGGGTKGRPDQLPQGRVPWCPKEYSVVRSGFDLFIKPCLDQERYEKVHDTTNWPLWQEGK
jgi:Putative metallopeptidase